MNIDGLVFLLNETGLALSQARQQIAQLSEENRALRAAPQERESVPDNNSVAV